MAGSARLTPPPSPQYESPGRSAQYQRGVHHAPKHAQHPENKQKERKHFYHVFAEERIEPYRDRGEHEERNRRFHEQQRIAHEQTACEQFFGLLDNADVPRVAGVTQLAFGDEFFGKPAPLVVEKPDAVEQRREPVAQTENDKGDGRNAERRREHGLNGLDCVDSRLWHLCS